MFRSTGESLDGRAILEVERAERGPDGLALGGTASAYEGNVLICVKYGPSVGDVWIAVQATAAGPNRGTWSALVPIQRLPASVLIGDENAEVGGIWERSLVELLVHADGRVSQVAAS